MGRYDYGKSKKGLRPAVPASGPAAAEDVEESAGRGRRQPTDAEIERAAKASPAAARAKAKRRETLQVPGRASRDEAEAYLQRVGTEFREEPPSAAALNRQDRRWVDNAIAHAKEHHGRWWWVRTYINDDQGEKASAAYASKKLKAAGLQVVREKDEAHGVTKLKVRFESKAGE